jgi:4-methylaminobutanoate oxidase (formaldehyde-forming)
MMENRSGSGALKMNPIPFPEAAQVVIIGGGVIGCSVAYHLAKLGWNDVVVLERTQLASGTTWHAAGLVVTSGFSEPWISISAYTRELYESLGEETGQPTGYKAVGYLQLATDSEWLHEMRRLAVFSRSHGVNMEEISAAEVKALWPLAETSDILAGFYTPEDGRVNPVDVTIALAKGAQMGGARIYEDTPVTGIIRGKGRALGVITKRGKIKAEYVVNCAGMWAREVGLMAGVNVPLHAAEHYYLITEQIEALDPELPIIEEYDRYAYYREEVGGLLLGFFEPVAAPWGMNGIPKDFSFGELPPDWDRMMPYIEMAMDRVPIVRNVGIRKFFCGPESFTPDGSCLMGEAPELRNFYVAAGFNSLGILQGGGAGRIMAEWIVEGSSPVDVTELGISRMLAFQNNPKYLFDRTVESLGMQYKHSWPNAQCETARNARQSVVHDRLAEAGAFFGEASGWEYPEWFAPEGRKPRVEYSWGRQNWFKYLEKEHVACRENVILMDLSSMSRFMVQGRDSERVLNYICANDVAVPIGKIVYTQWLNARGGMEADLTVTRLAEDRYLLVCAGEFHNRVHTWLRNHLPEEAHVFIADVTSSYTLLNVQGPKSRALLSQLTHADLSNAAFPYLTSKEIDLGYARPLALRITYEGELGWELYIPTEFARHVFDAIVAEGSRFGLVHAGFQALNTLRIEKAYREYGFDMDNTDSPLEAGLGFAVEFDKPGGFLGCEALLRQREKGIPKRRMVQFLLEDPEPLLHHGEIIYRDGRRVGHIRTGGYGFTLGGAVGMGYVSHADGVSRAYINQGSFEIDIAGERYPAQASLKPMYDPENERVRS